MNANLIEVKRFGTDGTWHARALWTAGEFIPTPFFGPSTFDTVAIVLRAKNPGFLVVNLERESSEDIRIAEIRGIADLPSVDRLHVQTAVRR